MVANPLTESEQQNLMLAELRMNASSDFANWLDLVWRDEEAAAVVSPRLRVLRVKLRAIDYLLGGEWESVDYQQQQVSEKEDQRFKHLLTLREVTLSDLAALNAALAASSGGGAAVGPITKVVPQSVPVGSFPDPNSSKYRGSPLPWWRRCR